MATPLQESIFAKVRDHIDTFGYPPLLREIEESVDGSRSMVSGAIDALIQGGRLERTAEKTRNLRVVGVPDLRSVGTDAMKSELARRGVTLEALSPSRPRVGRCCAAHGCLETVRPGMLMCRRHWFSLSPAVQTEVKRSFGSKDANRYASAVAAARNEAAAAGRAR